MLNAGERPPHQPLSRVKRVERVDRLERVERVEGFKLRVRGVVCRVYGEGFRV